MNEQPFVEIKIPILTEKQLNFVGPPNWGISAYRGIIIVWDEDRDERVLQLIDAEFSGSSTRPIALQERKGSISMMWHSEDAAIWCGAKDYTCENDYWPATHFAYVNGEIQEVACAGQ